MHFRFKKGDLVLTTESANRNDWVEGTRDSCLWGEPGVVVAVHDSHGLCYEVLHLNGKVGHYDHDELKSNDKRKYRWDTA